MGVDVRNPFRLALVLASIHTGSSGALWTSIADRADASHQSLFVFPGGRLDAPGEFEYLRNSIYRLINTETVDAVISWGSSLIGTVDRDQAVSFHQRFDPLPLVTIALPMENAQVVSFNAYEGMKAIVHHCIESHNATRIAFIRGPENHSSAEERYHAYRDALQESGLPIIDSLVSAPLPWHRGAEALQQLIEDRHLIPQKDFTMIVCASDLLMLNVAKVLEQKGYRIPEEVGIVGFNDSAESRFLSVPGTTVRVPFYELGKAAYNSMMQRLKGVCIEDETTLPAVPIIRYSCGCIPLEQQWEKPEGPFGRAEFSIWAIDQFHLDAEQRNALLDPLIDALYREEHEHANRFFILLGRVLERYFLYEGDTSSFQLVATAVSHIDDLDSRYVQRVVQRSRSLALETQSRIANRRSYENIKQAEILNIFKCDLLKAWSRNSLVSILCKHLPKLGIDQAHLVMDEDDNYSRYLGGYKDNNVIELSDMLFPSHRLLPHQLEISIGSGVHLVLPLFIENQALGYIILTSKDRDALKFEELRSSISSALKGLLLFEEMVKAKETAERAEQAELAFFAAMGESIKEPLGAFISQLSIDQDFNHNLNLKRLYQQMVDHREHISLLFDQTLAQVGSLEMHPRLVSFSSILSELFPEKYERHPEWHRLPYVLGDEKRLRQVLQLIESAFTSVKLEFDIEIQPVLDGLYLCLCGKGGSSLPDPPPLVESVILLHGGMFRKSQHCFEMQLPWPHLSDAQQSGSQVENQTLLVLTDESELDPIIVQYAQKCNLVVSKVSSEQVLQGLDDMMDGKLLWWDADSADTAQYIALLKMYRHQHLFSISVISFGSALDGGSSIITVVERLVRSRQVAPLLVWPSLDGLPLCKSVLVETLPSVELDRLSSIAKEVTLGGIILREVTIEVVDAIRAIEEFSSIPIIIIAEQLPNKEELERLGTYAHLLLCHTKICGYPEFCERIRDIASGGELLPRHTGILVKRAQQYIAKHAGGSITRWKIAESVNASEDYLTRIFKKELGMSPWEYLNRYRVELSIMLLQESDLPLAEIAARCGFQDQAYFCRVFKKVKYATPTSFRHP